MKAAGLFGALLLVAFLVASAWSDTELEVDPDGKVKSPVAGSEASSSSSSSSSSSPSGAAAGAAGSGGENPAGGGGGGGGGREALQHEDQALDQSCEAGTTDIRCSLRFEYIDKNHDGKISFKEMRRYSLLHDNFLTNSEVEMIFNDADDDASHTISREEYTEQVEEAYALVGMMKSEHIYVWMEHCPGTLLPYIAHISEQKIGIKGRELLLYAREAQLSTFESKFRIRDESARRTIQEQVLMGLVWKIQVSKTRPKVHAPELVAASSTELKLRVDFDEGEPALTPRVYKLHFCRTGRRSDGERDDRDLRSEMAQAVAGVGGSETLRVPLCRSARNPSTRIVDADTASVAIRGLMPDTQYRFTVEGFYCDGTSTQSDELVVATQPKSAIVFKLLRYCWFEPVKPLPPTLLAQSMNSVVVRFEHIAAPPGPSVGPLGKMRNLLVDFLKTYVVDNYCRKREYEVYIGEASTQLGVDRGHNSSRSMDKSNQEIRDQEEVAAEARARGEHHVGWGRRVGRDCAPDADADSFCVIRGLNPGTTYEIRALERSEGNRLFFDGYGPLSDPLIVTTEYCEDSDAKASRGSVAANATDCQAGEVCRSGRCEVNAPPPPAAQSQFLVIAVLLAVLFAYQLCQQLYDRARGTAEALYEEGSNSYVRGKKKIEYMEKRGKMNRSAMETLAMFNEAQEPWAFALRGQRYQVYRYVSGGTFGRVFLARRGETGCNAVVRAVRHMCGAPIPGQDKAPKHPASGKQLQRHPYYAVKTVFYGDDAEDEVGVVKRLQGAFANSAMEWHRNIIDVYYCHTPGWRGSPLKWMLMEYAELGDMDTYIGTSSNEVILHIGEITLKTMTRAAPLSAASSASSAAAGGGGDAAEGKDGGVDDGLRVVSLAALGAMAAERGGVAASPELERTLRSLSQDVAGRRVRDLRTASRISAKRSSGESETSIDSLAGPGAPGAGGGDLPEPPEPLTLKAAHTSGDFSGIFDDKGGLGEELKNMNIALVEKKGPISEDVCRWILRQLLEGLQAMHAVDYIHRDVKPGNMLLTSDGTIKICDFGKAILRPADLDENDDGKGSSGTDGDDDAGFKDAAGQGTLRYRPPEALIPVYCRAGDVWSCGVILLEAATGEPVSDDWQNPGEKADIDDDCWLEQVDNHLRMHLGESGDISDECRDILHRVRGSERASNWPWWW